MEMQWNTSISLMPLAVHSFNPLSIHSWLPPQIPVEAVNPSVGVPKVQVSSPFFEEYAPLKCDKCVALKRGG